PPPRPPAIETLAPASAKLAVSAHARSACEPHREWIEAQVHLGRNAMAIYQELVDQRGFQLRYNSVKRFCRALRKREPEQFDRLEFLPGEESQVDYGEGAPTLHPGNGRYRKPRLFVMTLRYSRRSYRQGVWKSSSEVWARLHEQAFRYFGGSTQYVVLDNLKEGVLTPDIYEPQLNRVYGAMLSHYGVVGDPARVRDPNRKGTVESAIQHTQATALQGTFWSVGPNVLAPIFDGGTLRFRRKAAIEAYRQSEASYRQTVLGAFAQVADTLRGLEHDAETLRAQSEQLATAQEALRLLQINYQTGMVNYLSVLNADTQYYQAKIGFLQTLAQRLQDTVALFVALGGGWW